MDDYPFTNVWMETRTTNIIYSETPYLAAVVTFFNTNIPPYSKKLFKVY